MFQCLLIVQDVQALMNSVTVLSCRSQWKPLVKDVQAEEEHSGGLTSVRAAEACRGHTGQRKPAHGRHATRWRGPQ